MAEQNQQLATVGDRICDLIVAGHYVKDAAPLVGLTVAQLAAMRRNNPDLDSAIRRARCAAAELRVDEMDDIARTEPDVRRAALRIDVIKWRAGKEAAATYGDRLDINVTQTVSLGDALAEARARALRLARDPVPAIDGDFVVLPNAQGEGAIDTGSILPEKNSPFG